MKKYTSPELEIKLFATEDIMTTSVNSMDKNTDTPVADVDNPDIGITIPYDKL